MKKIYIAWMLDRGTYLVWCPKCYCFNLPVGHFIPGNRISQGISCVVCYKVLGLYTEVYKSSRAYGKQEPGITFENTLKEGLDVLDHIGSIKII